jgi:hypothetical protein
MRFSWNNVSPWFVVRASASLFGSFKAILKDVAGCGQCSIVQSVCVAGAAVDGHMDSLAADD